MMEKRSKTLHGKLEWHSSSPCKKRATITDTNFDHKSIDPTDIFLSI